MARRRNAGVVYPTHVIEDRDIEVPTTQFLDSDGNVVDVNAGSPLPVVGTDDNITHMGELICLGKEILFELKKLNKSADEALDGEVL